jgi:hypothetical protein
MNIIADFHHADLWWSLQLLANRLDANLYRPYGMEWFDKGYLRLYGDPRRKDPYRYLAKQYLVDTIFDYNGKTGIGRETYNGCVDFPHFNLLTLEQARETKIDVVICSVHENEEYFTRVKEFSPKAKFIRQVGNDLDTNINQELYPNLMASATHPFNTFKGHKVLYRQEFDLNLFSPTLPLFFRNIYSFQNDLEVFEDAWICWLDLKHKLRDYTFKNYGGGCDDGRIYPKRIYIEKMLESSFIFSDKGSQPDGFGHVIHNAICLGRPMIMKFNAYVGRLAEPLLIENETYLEIDENLPDKIRFYSEPERLWKMSRKCHERFEETVNFDKEAIELKKFFDELI